VFDSLLFADEAGSGNWPFIRMGMAHRNVATVELLAQSFEALDDLRLETAMGQFLGTVNEPAFQEAAIVGWGSVSNRSRHCFFNSAVGVVFNCANRPSRMSVVIMVFHPALEVHDGTGVPQSEGNFPLSSEMKALTAAA
jgi:hypothetical protein